ncbi:MAG: type I-D CRISPR-associated helicase Cas3' [Pelatocladus maniniholoensis HA4357-MV3]|uniref:Type I-D CRISPR-associated helicase Cas3 n=1 Tax=Pelatocladus maniniholoensis HA4357-MV3 TaxID=1117104 RepID=A0A9E3LWT3_9NOST|nr:type I-D CRISPR-associated helicase Cas3' [Pelatocladus maniniholoensis HA4357-MV3]
MSENYSINLKPVYSQTVPTPDGMKLPDNWSLSWHQLATLSALRDPKNDVIINTAITGDGKSLAAYLLAMIDDVSTMATYPTNELARDQQKQIQNYKDKFQPKKDPQIYRLNAAILEDFIETNKLPNKQSGLINLSDQAEILLTNPDIFYYIHDFRYLRRFKKDGKTKGENANKLFSKIDDYYKLFIFDEFHVFSSAQVASIFNAILLIKHTVPGKKFLFLSATPNDLLLEFFDKSGIRYKEINPAKEHKYCFLEGGNQWRPISQPITLFFPQTLEPSLSSSYDWLIENSESVILKFFQDYPGSKGAIILNSIAAVKKLVKHFKSIFEPLGLKVRENTGLTGETEKAASVVEADLLLGTSTIDVGVDFRINFLVFEGADAGNFIQRFGRIGRHQDFHPHPYHAYALIPKFIVQRLFEVDSHPLQDGETYDRVNFTQAIRSSYPFVNEFKLYPKRWGAIQSACVHQELRRLTNQYPDADKNFKDAIEAALEVNIWQKYHQINQCLEGKKKKVIDEARSFRGSSQLDCGIYDLTNPEEPENEHFKIYNLPGILSNFKFEWMDKKEFIQQAEKSRVTTTRFQEVLCCLKLTGYREVREDWRFYYPEDISDIAKSGKVQVLKNLEIRQPHGSGINKISDAVSGRCLVCFISDCDRAYLRAKLGLPIHFQAYSLADKYSSDDKKSPPYTIAFGKSALMLETLLWFWKPKKDEGWIC